MRKRYISDFIVGVFNALDKLIAPFAWIKTLFGHRKMFSGQLRRRPNQPGRNDPCWCKSGRKYKKCCWLSDQKAG